MAIGRIQHKQTKEETKMHLLPLQSLLCIPTEGLTIVVDNAITRSPEESVSFRTQSRQHERHQRQRNSPPDYFPQDCRWSAAIPLPPLVTLEYAMDPCSAGSFLRASAVQVDRGSNESPKKKATTTTRCLSTTFPNHHKVRSDMLVEQQPTLPRSAACSFGSQLNLQFDAVQTATNHCQATKNPNPMVPKTRTPVEFVPAFIV